MRLEICLIEEDFDKSVVIRLWSSCVEHLVFYADSFHVSNVSPETENMALYLVCSILVNLRLMATFPDTEIDWHDVAFDYPGELILPEN